jgi:hypothetical protein
MTADYGNLPFKEAETFFKDKVRIPTRRWDDLKHGMHARGFMIAGAQRDDMLCDFQTALRKAIEQGTTLETFRGEFDRIVSTYGWSYKGGRGWRTRVIYDTHLRTAHMAGRYKQMTDPDVLAYRPNWMYRHNSSRHPRPQHMAWNGLVLSADDPFWSSHYPPNGWHCHCSVEPLSGRDLARQGKSGPDKAPPLVIDPKTGEPEGIGKGWGYNVGEAAWGKNQAARLMEDRGPWRDMAAKGPADYGRPANLPVDKPLAVLGKPVPRGDERGLRAALRSAIGGDEKIINDPAGGKVMVTQAITDHIIEKPATRWDGREAYFPFIRELIEDPSEIWINFAQSDVSGRVAIRRKYVKVIDLGKSRTLGLYAETQEGFWISGDMFRGSVSGAKNLRKGRLVYGREERL